jgi:hypothetical protein
MGPRQLDEGSDASTRSAQGTIKRVLHGFGVWTHVKRLNGSAEAASLPFFVTV